MAETIGKRKRATVRTSPGPSDEGDAELRVKFQRAFEAKFKPLEPSNIPTKNVASSQDSESAYESDDSDWKGLSEDDDSVEVFDVVEGGVDEPLDVKRERKAFMTSKPPMPEEKKPLAPPKVTDKGEDDTENANLKNDLALQRLLKESHLLDPSNFSGNGSAPEGKSRLKALDLRLQDLGAKNAIAKQRMPVAHRKGMEAKARSREEKRRRDAAENGVVLEKVRASSKPRHGTKPGSKRERGVGGPSVGKFMGGTLKLSAKDLKDIQGPKRVSSKGKRGRR